MTADVAVSLSVLAGIVALSDVTRRLLTRALANTGLSVYAVELVSTFQLCCCTHELKLLSEVGGIEPRLALTFTYLASVVHGLTFSGAIGNPSGALERAYHAKLSGACALRRIACQFAAAAAARATVPRLWGVGLSRLHARHKLLGFRCTSPIHAPLHEAAAVELACAFAVQTVITHTQSVEEKYRVHAVAAVITTAVYAGFCFKCGHDMADVSNATDQSLLPVSHLVPLPSTANKVSASNVDMTWLMSQTPPISHYFLSRTWYHCPPLQIRMSRKAQTQMDVEVNAVEKHLMKFIRTFTVPGGSVTGAVFNPALAFSTQFPCSGHSFLEYCVVYWLGPLLGMMSSVLLLDKLVPALSGKPSPLHLPAESKKKA